VVAIIRALQIPDLADVVTNMNLSGISNETLLGRALRLPLRLIPRGARIPILQGPLRGMLWIAGAGNHGCWLGSYEQEKQNLFCRHVHRGDVVYDIGANAGFYTLLASKLTGDEGTVFSFEPLPRNVAYLRRHLELNRIGNCTVLECAVSARTGLAAFELGENSHVGRLTMQESNTIQVRTATLDHLAASGELRRPT
jgi:FkbM family methyltransferase